MLSVKIDAHNLIGVEKSVSHLRNAVLSLSMLNDHHLLTSI